MEVLGSSVATRLIAALAVIFLLGGCMPQPGPPDKAVSGKEYKEIVNSTVPANEQGQTNTVRDSVTAPNAKR